VLSEPLAANLAGTVVTLRDQGVSIFAYPLAVSLLSPRQATGMFEFRQTGPPGIYAVQSSTNLATWSDLGTVTNSFGNAVFTDAEAQISPTKFYRARTQ
jgi:hypothetical protein